MSRKALNEDGVSSSTAAIIEPGIRPVCDALNSIPGVVTAYSCEGHWIDGRHPFVIFDAPGDVALRIHRLIGHGYGDGRLKVCWWLQGRFQDDGSMRYIIEPNDYRISRCGGSWWPSRWLLWVSMGGELKRLAAILNLAA
jgi:hypothetical protein